MAATSVELEHRHLAERVLGKESLAARRAGRHVHLDPFDALDAFFGQENPYSPGAGQPLVLVKFHLSGFLVVYLSLGRFPAIWAFLSCCQPLSIGR
jgi:hypothetical protein